MKKSRIKYSLISCLPGIALANVAITQAEATIASAPTIEQIAEDPSLFDESWDANKVVEIMEEKYDGDSSSSIITMTLKNSRGQERTRTMRSYRKDVGADLKDERMSTVFLKPDDIQDTTFLNYEYDNEAKEEESWLYLPSLKKSKRLSASDKSDAFMGSDFSYNDLKTNHREYWNYQFIKKSEIIDGEDCWVIEGTPREDKLAKVRDETGYKKTRIWVQKSNFTKVRGQFWLLKGNRVKLYKATNYEKIDGVWTPLLQQMVTTKNNRVEHATTLHYSDVQYNVEISDSFLTPYGIESRL